MRIKILFFIVNIFVSQVAFSQSITITGKVVDGSTGKPLEYVNIYLPETHYGTITNIEGNFSLSIPSLHNEDTLVFSIIGFETKKILLKNITGCFIIKLKPYNQTIDQVTVRAKRINPANILKQAMKNIKENVYNNKYQTKVLARNFIQKDSIFVLYRKTLMKTIANGDDVWSGRGDVLMDKYLTLKKNVTYINDKLIHFGIALQTFNFLRNLNNKEIDRPEKNIVKIDTVIFSKNQKIYVIDYFEKSINPNVLSYVYGFLKKNPSPYTVIFDKSAQNEIIKSFDANDNKPFLFTRYYIDAKQNYNITKSISFNIFSNLDILSMTKTFLAEYTVSYYSNKMRNSVLTHSISYRKPLYKQKTLYSYYDFSSLFEQFCYEPNFSIHDTSNDIKNWNNTISYKYNKATNYGTLAKSYDNWNEKSGFVKTDSLEQMAVNQILYPEKYYDIKKFYAKLDSAKNIKIEHQKRQKPEIEIPIKISGTVIDSVTYDPLPYCNIIVKNLDDTTKKIIGAITGEDGAFKFDVLLGYKYSIQISQIGYKTLADTFDLYVAKNELRNYADMSSLLNIDAEQIALSIDTGQLQTITIKGETKTLNVDKQSEIVTSEMRKNTISTRDLLEKVNGINFNKITEDIKIDGSKNVKLLVDGVEKRKEYILNISPKRIKKIEILRNLSGLYAMEGYTSVVNIITYDNYRGCDIEINDQFLNNIYQKENPYFKQNDVGVSVNVFRNKWSFYVKSHNYYSDIGLITGSLTSFAGNDENIINGNNNMPNHFDKSNQYGIDIGADYKINRNHLLGVEMNFSGFPAVFTNKTVSFDTLQMNNIKTIQQNTTNINSSNNRFSANLYYNFNINTTSKFITYLYVSDKKNISNQNVNNNKDLRYNQSGNNVNCKLEYNKTFKRKYTLTMGGRYLANNFESINNDGIQENFVTELTKLTAYTYWKMRINKNLGLSAGAFFENYKSKNNDLEILFNSLQPKISLYKTIKKRNKFVLEYSLRTEYPYMQDLNPQMVYITPFIAGRGNPELKPYLYHDFSFQYSKISNGVLNYFSIMPYYNYTGNEMGISPLTNDSLIIYQTENFVKHENYGVYTNLSFKINKDLKLDFDFNLYKDWNKNLKTPDIIDWNGDAQISYSLNTKHYFGLMYQKEYARLTTSLGYEKSGVNYALLYWKTLQLKGRLQLMVGYSLPVLPDQINVDYEETPYYQKTAYTDVSLIKNMILVNLVYRFSKGKVSKTNKNIDYENYDSKSKKAIINL
jgi:hypothetical protein